MRCIESKQQKWSPIITYTVYSFLVLIHRLCNSRTSNFWLGANFWYLWSNSISPFSIFSRTDKMQSFFCEKNHLILTQVLFCFIADFILFSFNKINNLCIDVYFRLICRDFEKNKNNNIPLQLEFLMSALFEN